MALVLTPLVDCLHPSSPLLRLTGGCQERDAHTTCPRTAYCEPHSHSANMPPNRRAISCPDLFALDDDSLQWSSWIKNQVPIGERAERQPLTDPQYWDWQADAELLRLQTLEDDASVTESNAVEEDSSSFQAGDESYWNWTQWRHKDSSNRTMAPSAVDLYWCTDSAVVTDKLAVAQVYQSNCPRRQRAQQENTRVVCASTTERPSIDYWYGM
jgi:hypothetical protein